MVERDIIGGAAHLLDCIPSKTMIATGGAMSFVRRSTGMGLEQAVGRGRHRGAHEPDRGHQDPPADGHAPSCSQSQGVRLVNGSARFVSPTSAEVETVERHRGRRVRRRPRRHRVPAAGPRVVLTRRRPHPDDARLLPAEGVPEQRHGRRLGRHGRRVRAHVLVVRRRGDARRVAPAGAAGQGPRGRRGARGGLPGPRRASCSRGPGRPRSSATTRRPSGDRSSCAATTAGSCARRHAVLAIGSVPNTDDLGLDAAGVDVDAGGYIPINHHCVTNVAAHLRRRRRERQAAAVVGGVDAGPQGRRARDGSAHARAPPPRLRQGRVGHLHRARDRRRRARRGRGVRRRAARSGSRRCRSRRRRRR